MNISKTQEVGCLRKSTKFTVQSKNGSIAWHIDMCISLLKYKFLWIESVDKMGELKEIFTRSYFEDKVKSTYIGQFWHLEW